MEKGKILDEFTKVTGYHHKAAIRLLRRGDQQSAKKKRGRPRQYGIAVAEALRVVWEATDRLCSKRLHPFLPELVKILRRHGETTITADIEAQLCWMSPSTIDRLGLFKPSPKRKANLKKVGIVLVGLVLITVTLVV